MGRKGAINLFVLGELIRAGKATKEIAEHFKVKPRAVQRRAKKLGLSITKNAALHQAKHILQQDLDAREQLLKINESANRVLDLLEEQLRQDQEEAVNDLAGRIRGLNGGTEHEGQVKGIIADLQLLVMTRPATIDQLFKAQAEIRQQIALVVKVAAELLEANRVNEVHRIIVEEIGIESPECQGRIIRRLQGSNLLLTAVGFA
jgi:hypothetical protein